VVYVVAPSASLCLCGIIEIIDAMPKQGEEMTSENKIIRDIRKPLQIRILNASEHIHELGGELDALSLEMSGLQEELNNTPKEGETLDISVHKLAAKLTLTLYIAQKKFPSFNF